MVVCPIIIYYSLPTFTNLVMQMSLTTYDSNSIMVAAGKINLGTEATSIRWKIEKLSHMSTIKEHQAIIQD